MSTTKMPATNSNSDLSAEKNLKPSASHSLTLRVKITNTPGMLGKLTSLIGEVGGDIGAIDIHGFENDAIIRDITVKVRDSEHGEKLVIALKKLEGVEVVNVSDRTFLMHLGGKIRVTNKVPLSTRDDLSMAYTPGVARVCMAIHNEPENAYKLTIKRNTVAVVSDGTAVLGLGNIGPEAAMPVMEGKAMLFKEFGKIDAFPICLATQDTEEIIKTCKHIAPGFGGINLEDISAPRCFEIEERLQAMLDIPVLHDDQHGTAVVSTAALMTATREAGMDMKKAVIGQIGLGAAGQAIGQMMMRLTGNPVHGADLSPEALSRFEKMGGVKSNLKDIMANCDIVVATTGAPNLIKPEMVRKGQIILALSNPNAEIDPEVAMERGAAFAADGKSVNNVLGFPGIFRGAVDSNSPRITQEMLLAAAETIASMTPSGELVPNPLDKKVHHAVARAVAEMAIKQGIARADYVPYVEE